MLPGDFDTFVAISANRISCICRSVYPFAMLTLRQLRSFRTLSETLHFGEAARRLNISQPALSRQIAAMEEAFGGLLFERRPSGVTMTQSGVAIVERVRAILTDVEDLEGLGAPSGLVLSGRLRLGLIATVAPYLLPAAARAARGGSIPASISRSARA